MLQLNDQVVYKNKFSICFPLFMELGNLDDQNVVNGFLRCRPKPIFRSVVPSWNKEFVPFFSFF